MKIANIYCHIYMSMNKGQFYSGHMYTTVEYTSGEEKEYWRELSQTEAGIAIRKLQKATGIKPHFYYNQFDSSLTGKEIVVLIER